METTVETNNTQLAQIQLSLSALYVALQELHVDSIEDFWGNIISVEKRTFESIGITEPVYTVTIRNHYKDSNEDLVFYCTNDEVKIIYDNWYELDKVGNILVSAIKQATEKLEQKQSREEELINNLTNTIGEQQE